MSTYLIPVLLCVFCFPAYSQESKECVKCNVASVVEVEQDLASITDGHLYAFLCSFDRSCALNIEYSEYSNEILFNVLASHPGKVIRILSKKPGLDFDYLYQVMSAPLLDCDLEMLYLKIKKCRGDKDVKRNMLKALEIAKDDDGK